MTGGSGERETAVTFTGLLASSHRRHVILSDHPGEASASTIKVTSCAPKPPGKSMVSAKGLNEQVSYQRVGLMCVLPESMLMLI
jgi:hypothetical protein